MYKFNDAELIEYVRQFGCLWDSRLGEYKNTKIKENAWITISEIIHLSVEICQSRWLALRQRYVREKRENRYVPSGSGASGGTTWHLFNNMKFLDSVVKQRRTAGNLSLRIASPAASPSIPLVVETSSSTPPVSPWDSVSEILVTDSNCDEDIVANDQPSCSYQTDVVPSPPAEKEKKRKCQQDIPVIPKRKRSESETLSNSITNAFATLDRIITQPEPERPLELNNVNYSFGRTIALMLEKMAPQEQKVMRQRIMAQFLD